MTREEALRAYRNAVHVWSEDDATVSCAGHVDLRQAMTYWNVPTDGELVEAFDFGDEELRVYARGWYVMSSYAGNNAIRREHPEGKI